MSVIATIFNAIMSFLAAIFSIIFIILFSAIICIYAIFYSVFGEARPRYEVTEDFLAEQGIENIRFIGSEFEVTGDYKRTYSNITREEYDEYCEYLFDYINSKGYPIYRFKTSYYYLGIPFFPRVAYDVCNSMESLFSDDGCTFEIYYTYNDKIRGIKVSYSDTDVIVGFHEPSDLDEYSNEHDNPSETDAGELVPVPAG